jgi:hypothetical protein
MATPNISAAVAAAPKLAPKFQRTEHWATREYHAFLLARAKMPFAWGANDCASFAADGILAMTGVDIAAAFRGKYSDEASALEAIRIIAGGATIADAAAWCAAQHELAEWKYPLMAKRGDLVVFTAAGQLQSGLVHLTGRHVAAPGDRGLKLMEIGTIAVLERSWHVGPPEHAVAHWSHRV